MPLGRVFQAAGSVCEKERSPNFVCSHDVIMWLTSESGILVVFFEDYRYNCDQRPESRWGVGVALSGGEGPLISRQRPTLQSFVVKQQLSTFRENKLAADTKFSLFNSTRQRPPHERVLLGVQQWMRIVVDASVKSVEGHCVRDIALMGDLYCRCAW